MEEWRKSLNSSHSRDLVLPRVGQGIAVEMVTTLEEVVDVIGTTAIETENLLSDPVKSGLVGAEVAMERRGRTATINPLVPPVGVVTESRKKLSPSSEKSRSENPNPMSQNHWIDQIAGIVDLAKKKRVTRKLLFP